MPNAAAIRYEITKATPARRAGARTTTRTLFSGIVAAILVGGPACAHHSPAFYDLTTRLTIEGDVTRIDWKNPHIYLSIATTDSAGRTVVREVEGGPIAVVQAAGLPKDRLRPGDHVVVRLSPSRRGPEYAGWGVDVTTSDGTLYALNPQGGSNAVPQIAATAGSLAGNWAPSIDSFKAFMLASHTTWSLKDDARAARAANVPSGTCEPFPSPLLTALPALRRIEIGDAAVVIRLDSDFGEIVRTVRLNATEHPQKLAPSEQGDSIGHWEADALVIDTVGFAPNRSGLTDDVPSGPRKHLVERLSLADDHRHIQYAVTLADPDELANPVSYTALWDYRPDLEPSREPCDPEVARRWTVRDGSSPSVDAPRAAIAPAPPR
jgi:hypothetical protein